MIHLVNRIDAWGGYRDPSDWDKEYRRQDGRIGKLGRTTTRKGHLTTALLARHFGAKSRADIIGLHSTSQENTCKWGALDIDWHGLTSTAPEINLRAALAWYAKLVALGFNPLLVDSNGAGGYHLFILFASPVPSPCVHAFLKHLIFDHARYGMACPPETFPKQPLVRPRPDGSPGFGNWVRLVGHHHTRDHWGKVWNGKRWLEGAEAIEFILALKGDSPELIPAVPIRPEPAPRPCRAPVFVPADKIAARIRGYIAKLPSNLGEGTGRDNHAYILAAFLLRDLALSDDVALDWLSRWDSSNTTPNGMDRLREILQSAHQYGRNAVGSGLVLSRPRRHKHFTVRVTVEVP
jgi:hypothetical protein